MNNIFNGLAIVLSATTVYVFAFLKFRDKKYDLAIFLLLLGGLILRCYASLDNNLHEWDERYHALVAKNLLKHFFTPTLYDDPVLPFDYRSWTSNHIWVHKQPVTLWLIAWSLKIFGFHAWAVRVPSVVVSVVSIKLLYDIAGFLFNKKIAFLSAFLFSIHGLVIELAAGRVATDHVDTIFLFFILLAIWSAIKYARSANNYFTVFLGIALGLAILTKWLPALFVMPMCFIISYYLKKDDMTRIVSNFTIILLAAIIVALPWQIYIISAFPVEAAWEYALNKRHFFEVLDGQGGSFLFFIDKIRMQYGELVYLPLIWLMYVAFKKKTTVSAVLAVWIWIPLLFFSFAATKMDGYIIIIAPAIFMVTALFYYRLKELEIKPPLYKYLVYAVMVALILLPVRYTLERLKPFAINDPDDLGLKSTHVIFGDKTIVFNCKKPIEMMFYNNCIAYDSVPPIETLNELKLKGYSIFILN